jgi:methyltransferase
MSVSATLFVILVLLVGAERVAELILSKRHIAWSVANGGREFGAGHYPAMVALHSALLVGSVVEVLTTGRRFLPWLGWPMLMIVLAAQSLRWWCIATLGRRWNTKIVVIPGLPLVTGGPYRWLRHPNYVAVIAEGVALPLVHTAWLTSLSFTIANAWLLRIRINAENTALATALAT